MGEFLMGKGRKEALRSMKEENTCFEALYYFSSKNGLYALGLQEWNGKPKSMNMKRLINKKHNKIFTDCLLYTKNPSILDLPLSTSIKRLYVLFTEKEK